MKTHAFHNIDEHPWVSSNKHYIYYLCFKLFGTLGFISYHEATLGFFYFPKNGFLFIINPWQQMKLEK
jgi:hypothetical protein